MAYHHTIKDIEKKTGLNISFIRRCLTHMKEIFDPCTAKGGNNNAIMFDDNALVIFDRIKQLKSNNSLTLPEIKQRLSDALLEVNKPSENDAQTLTNETINVIKPRDHEFIKELYERLLDEKDKSHQTEIKAHKTMIDALQSKLKLLTDGRDPEEIKREAERLAQEKKEIFSRLEELEGRWFKSSERKELIKRLRELDGVA